MLLRRSLRTMPVCCSTSGPFEPSPGYGPAVSSGISASGSAADDGALFDDADGAVLTVAVGVDALKSE